MATRRFINRVALSFRNRPVLNAIEGHSTPSSLILEKEGKIVEGDYFEITSNLMVRLDEKRTQLFHKEQIILYIKGTNLF